MSKSGIRIGAYRKSENKKDGGDDIGGPQLVAVAVDDDRSSRHALKWAADHQISRGQAFILLHVRRKITSVPTPTGRQLPIEEVDEEVASAFREQIDLQTKELLLPFQCFCSRRGLICKEIILDGIDIPKTMAEYVLHQSVDKLVLGASSRGALARTFKNADVPTSVSRIAPEFCSVYVISKGKLSSVRPAPRPNKHPAKLQLSRNVEFAGHSFLTIKSDPDGRSYIQEVVQSPLHRGANIGYIDRRAASARNYDSKTADKFSRFSQVGEHLDFSYQSMSSCPSPRTIIDRSNNHHLRNRLNGIAQQPHFSNTSDWYSYSDERMRSSSFDETGMKYWSNESGFRGYEHPPSSPQESSETSWSASSMEDMDAEMGRLKLEQKQSMNIYRSASTVASKAKQVRDLHLWKEEDLRVATESSAEEKESVMAPEAVQAAQNIREIEARKQVITEKKVLMDMEKRTVVDALPTNIRYRKYTIEEIQNATDNFSEKLKIGEGGYGPVFKATLDHSLVAIKVLRTDAVQGMEQFQQEVEVLSCIRHPNMVLLMGACPDSGCLVYEYMDNGSLEDRLFCRSNTPPLTWQQRFRIIAEIATGLLFLHQTKPEPLVHRDLKPGNILLDQNFVSKIADVGLARLVPPSIADAVTQYRMTATAGTFCYIDPEYQKTGLVGTKSDVYALGIIILQMITGKQPMGLAYNVENALEMHRLKEMLDPMVPDWPMEEVAKLAQIGLMCAELQRKDRPDLGKTVLPELNRMRALANEARQDQLGHRNQDFAGSPMVTWTSDSSFLDDTLDIAGIDRTHHKSVVPNRTGGRHVSKNGHIQPWFASRQSQTDL